MTRIAPRVEADTSALFPPPFAARKPQGEANLVFTFTGQQLATFWQNLPYFYEWFNIDLPMFPGYKLDPGYTNTDNELGDPGACNNEAGKWPVLASHVAKFVGTVQQQSVQGHPKLYRITATAEVILIEPGITLDFATVVVPSEATALLNGDQQTNIDTLLLSGDQQTSGTDALLLSGDQA